MVELSLIRDCLAIFGVLAGFSYYVLTVRVNQKNQELNLRNQEIMIRNQEETLKTRNATLFLQTLGQLITRDEALKHVFRVEQHPFSSLEEYRELMKDPEYALSNVYVRIMGEFWGVFLKNNIIDIKMFSEVQPYWIPRFWEMNKESIYDSRKRLPSFYRNLEYMVDALQKYNKEHPELAT